MIETLHVHNLALIHDAYLEPSRGLTVLTGETGAGKSALISAMKLLIGERADAQAVREGADYLEIESEVSGILPLHDDMDRSCEADGECGAIDAFEADDDVHLVRRRVTKDGRSRATIDGSLASVRELNARVGSLIDLCGQHEHQRLLNPLYHTEVLESWIGEEASSAHQAYSACYRQRDAAQKELDRIKSERQADEALVAEQEDILNRIDRVNPQEGELEELEVALKRLEHAESLIQLTSAAYEALSADEGAGDILSQAAAQIENAARFDESLAGFVESIDGIVAEVEDCASGLRRYRDSIELDGQALDEARRRHSDLYQLMRTYGPRIEDVFARRQKAFECVSLARHGDEQEKKQQHIVDVAEVELQQAAEHLMALYFQHAPGLERVLADQMAQLEMGTAYVEFSIEQEPRKNWTAQSPCHIELLYHPGAHLSGRPLKNIASGGELSRVMLAIKVILGAADTCSTLIFDEVDAGVGGTVAVALAACLRNLAKTHQVIVATHLPQVAVAATVHYVVRKEAGDVPQTTLVQVEGQERMQEIARMLSGDITHTSLEHARELLS